MSVQLHTVELQSIKKLDYALWRIFYQLSQRFDLNEDWYGVLQKPLGMTLPSGVGVVSMVAFRNATVPLDAGIRIGDMRQGPINDASSVWTVQDDEGAPQHVLAMAFPHMKLGG